MIHEQSPSQRKHDWLRQGLSCPFSGTEGCIKDFDIRADMSFHVISTLTAPCRNKVFSNATVHLLDTIPVSTARKQLVPPPASSRIVPTGTILPVRRDPPDMHSSISQDEVAIVPFRYGKFISLVTFPITSCRYCSAMFCQLYPRHDVPSVYLLHFHSE
jgi:hypothetical protein